MKREILFRRAHYEYNGKFHSFSEWGFVKYGFSSPSSISVCDTTKSIDDQFTGVTDKNGVKIFQGDKLKISVGHKSRLNVIWDVVFFVGSFCIYDKETAETPLSFIGMRDLCIENLSDPNIENFITVVGNIHENR